MFKIINPLKSQYTAQDGTTYIKLKTGWRRITERAYKLRKRRKKGSISIPGALPIAKKV